MSALDTIWCCLACRWKGRAGITWIIPGSNYLHCPECKAPLTEVADGGTVEVAEGHNWKPDVLQ